MTLHLEESLLDVKPPLLSLCVIAGDEGAKTLVRLLKSVLVRPGGPMVDEVVVAWNGRDDGALARALADLARTAQGDESRVVSPLELSEAQGELREAMRVERVALRVLRQAWTGNFAAARQESFEAASGVWRMYLDCDDVVPIWDDDGPDGRRCVEESLRWCGVDVAKLDAPVGSPTTRQEYLRALPREVNCVEFPYDYTIGGDGKALWRYWRRRIVRWADGWIWREQLNFHEDLFPAGGCVPIVRGDGGLPIRHYPSEDVHDRTARNRAILQVMLDETKRGLRPVDARLLYNMATFELQGGNWLAAEQLLDQALRAGPGDADMRLYRYCRGKALIALGRHAEAVYEAAALVGHDAQAFEGWALYTECAYNRGEWPAVVEYGRHAIQGTVRPDATDKPVEREAHLRVMMATAHARRGEFEDAVYLAEEALERAPQDAFSKDAAKRIRAESQNHAALEHAVALGGYHAARRDAARLCAALDGVPHGVRHDLRVQALRAKLDALRAEDVGAAPPLPIFRAPSPWARLFGSWALAEGLKRVVLRGRPHLDDVRALREIVPGVEWIGPDESPPEDGETYEAVASIDQTHLAEGGQRLDFVDFATFPAPEVKDPARRAVIGLDDVVRFGADAREIRELRLLVPPRPDSDVARVVMALGGERGERRRVDFFCPHWAEVWGPDALTESGCGGSEEAVVYLARELSSTGFSPHVYGPWRPPGGIEVRDGVWWHDIRDFDPCESGVPVVAHRAPWVQRDSAFGKRPVYVWHHDHDYPDEVWTAEIAKATRHLFVSRWQERELLKKIGLEPGAVRGGVVGNGVPREEFDVSNRALPPPRDARRVFYASQPQRGLLPLLKAWPKVLEAEPEAVLDVYYGWQTAEALARSSQPRLWETIREIDALLRESQRVNVVGRLPQARLSEEMLRSGVLAYPCTYPEVSCVTGLRAAAAGCAVVYTKVAALPETMPDDTFALDPASSTTEDLAATIVRAIRAADYPRDNIARLVLARDSWSAVAARVAALFAEPHE